MRLIYTLLAVLIFTSCSKKDAIVSGNPTAAAVDATQVIDATINTDFTYQLPLTSPDIKIHKQAAHFELSAIGIDAKNGMTVYKYLPAKGFTGRDEVTLKETTTYTNYSDGEGCRDMSAPQNITKTSFVKIRFTVAD